MHIGLFIGVFCMPDQRVWKKLIKELGWAKELCKFFSPTSRWQIMIFCLHEINLVMSIVRYSQVLVSLA